MNCDHHRHPCLKGPISEERFKREFWKLYYFSGLPAAGIRVAFEPSLAKVHDRNPRRYAQVTASQGLFEFAPQALLLPKKNRSGLIAHEIGHALFGETEHTEDDADDAAEKALGVIIDYDRRWPGKGLQIAVPTATTKV